MCHQHLPNNLCLSNRTLLSILFFIKPVFGFDKSVVNASVGLEYVDWNMGKFKSTGGNISEHVFSVVPALSFRPVPETVFRINYRHNWQTDMLGNPAARLAAFQFGISPYF